MSSAELVRTLDGVLKKRLTIGTGPGAAPQENFPNRNTARVEVDSAANMNGTSELRARVFITCGQRKNSDEVHEPQDETNTRNQETKKPGVARQSDVK
jgi:hypothetical protein